VSRRRKSLRSRKPREDTSGEELDLECYDEEGFPRPLCRLCTEPVLPDQEIMVLRMAKATIGKRSGCTNYEDVFFPDGDEEKMVHVDCFVSEYGLELTGNDPKWREY
jgi:hypothetical protein